MKDKLPTAKSGIHINPKNKGKFNATKKATGKTTEELTHSKNPVTRKRAIFAQNAKKWHHKKNGGRIPYAALGDQISVNGGGYNWNTNDPNAPQAPDPGYPYNIPVANQSLNTSAALPPSTDNTPAPGNGPVPLSTRRNPRNYWPLGYNPGMAAYSFDKAADARVAGQRTTDPTLQNQYHHEMVGNNVAGAGYTMASVFNGVENILGPISAEIATRRANMNERAAFNRNNRERAEVNPYRGDDSQLGNGTRAAYEYGGMVPSFEYGGVPTEGSDFDSENPNVITERGETITDPTRGPMGPNGPTGVVVHDQTGDLHSAPSGGNSYRLGPDSVIHSKSLGVTVADFVKYAAGFPNADFIVGKIAAKFPNPDRKVSFAQLASVFDTSDLVKEVGKIAKKANKIDEKSLGTDDTHITQVTDKLNKKTLAHQDEETKQEIEANAQVAGPDGPIHRMAEHLKKTGAYGEEVKNDDGSAKYGKKIMKGKKLLLPTAGNGAKIKSAIHENAYRIDPNESGDYGEDKVAQRLLNQGFTPEEASHIIDRSKDPLATNMPASVAPVDGGIGYMPGLDELNLYSGNKDLLHIDKYRPDANLNARQPFDESQADQSNYKMGGKIKKYARGGKRISVPTNDTNLDNELPPDTIPLDPNFGGDPNDTQDYSIIDKSGAPATTPSPQGFGMPIYNNGVYANTGYNDMTSDEYDMLYPNMQNADREAGRQLVRSGQIIPSGDFTKVPTIYHQPLNPAGTYGAAMPWEKLASDPNSGRGYYKTYAQDYKANQIFKKNFAELTPQEQAQVTGWSPVQKNKAGQYEVDPGYVKYHQSRYNQALQEEHPGYHYYDPNGDPNKNPWSIDAKSGEITTNEPWLVRKSYGSVGAPAMEYSKSEPVVYVNEAGKKVVAPTQPVQPADRPASPGMAIRRRIYQEGLDPRQIISPLAALFEPREAVPYIEDQGAKDALAMTTRQRFTDIQPGLNRITRGAQAATRYNPQNNQAYNAQVAANAWTAENELQGQKFNNDNQIEQTYNDRQAQLRQAAGTNKARALDTLAQRTATAKWKKTAMDINALGEIGNKSLQNSLENKTAALYQDMFPNYGYDPFTGTTFTGGSAGYPQIGPSTRTEHSRVVKKEDDGSETTTITYRDGTVHSIKTPRKKFGGKLPKKKSK